MFRVKSVKIDGFWGRNIIETNLYKDVDIFIGRNGTGKTTFIKLLQAVLSTDLELLSDLQFEKIAIQLADGNKTRKIEVSKQEEDLQYKSLHYKIGKTTYKLPIVSDREFRYMAAGRRYSGRIHPRFYDEVESVKAELEKLTNVSYLSVSRANVQRDDSRESRRENAYDLIEIRLKELIGQLTNYQLQLETELSKHSKDFQKEVLRSMLFNEEYDKIDYGKEIKLDLAKTKKELTQAYNGLGILDTTTQTLIDAHIAAIEAAANAVNKHINDKSALYADNVTPLTLLRRTQKVNESSNTLEETKKRILTPLLNYIRLLNDFHDNKKFALKDNKEGGISITKENTEIPISQLSSGEKQLIILLTETLLQRSKQTIFIADEPELSLHIEWQRKILSSIRELNPNSQIIVATHSPEIVGKYKANIINMGNIMK